MKREGCGGSEAALPFYAELERSRKRIAEANSEAQSSPTLSFSEGARPNYLLF